MMNVRTRPLHVVSVVFLAGLVVVSAVAGVPAAPAMADSAPPAETNVSSVVALANLRVRGGPGTEFPILGGIEAGTVVLVTGSSDPFGWWRISCPDGAAPSSDGCWISAEFAHPPVGVFGGPSDPRDPPPSADADGAWHLITSDAYGFRLEIPPTGTLADPMGARPQGPCGTSVREGPTATAGLNGVVVDNLLFVEVLD